jgi:large conductance mechanosensitive channel
VEDKDMSVDKGLANAKKLGGDFKKFIMKGNVVDLAVAVIIGGAFGKIVASLVNDILMPLIVLITGQNSLSALSVTLREAVGDGEPLLWKYGNFIQTIIDFLIIAFCIFLFVKFFERFKKKEEAAPAAPPEPSAQEKLLTEIRDELRKRG